LGLGPRNRSDLPSSWRALISDEKNGWFYRLVDGTRTAFYWSAPTLPDLDSAVGAADEESGYCLLHVLPILAFLRSAFRERTWHAPRSMANFIVDDPPVRERYGYFSPQRLIEALKGERQATTVAFIPWNWNRATTSAVQLFKQHASELMLCVHGCDHTAGEFASTDRRLLEEKSALAQNRMDRLFQRTGLTSAPIMVFPQGRFGTAALSALRDTGFLAAVNSTLLPEDRAPGTIRLRDLVTPALSTWEDFPVFLRRYPTDPLAAAIALYLGRPLIAVEHHEYFNDGYAACREFFATVNGFHSAPDWVSLNEIVTQSYLQRRASDGAIDIKCFADVCLIVNDRPERTAYRVVRECRHPEAVQKVTVNDSITPHQVRASGLHCEVVLEPQTGALVQLHRQKPQVDLFRGSPRYKAGVWARRRLCDLRDNHPAVAGAARALKSSVRHLARLTGTIA